MCPLHRHRHLNRHAAMSSVHPCCISLRAIARDCNGAGVIEFAGIFSTVDACTATINIRSRGRGGGLLIRARPSLGLVPWL
jgi:hypothetical protein